MHSCSSGHLLYAKVGATAKKRASVIVWTPVLAQILNAALPVGLIPSHVHGGLMSLVVKKGDLSVWATKDPE